MKARKLVINKSGAAKIQYIFERFREIGSGTHLLRELAERGIMTRHGKPITKGFLYRVLNNRVYIGDVVHKGNRYPGEHEAIISTDLWDAVHTILKESPRVRGGRSRAKSKSFWVASPILTVAFSKNTLSRSAAQIFRSRTKPLRYLR